MPATSTARLSLSQIRVWDTHHLIDAANRWTKTARVWDDAFSAVAREIGIPWKGEAAEAAMRQAALDRVKVVAIADDLRNAAAIARRGAGQLEDAKQAVLSAVARAQEDGFEVAEDLSVIDNNYSPTAADRAAREALAQAHANQIGTKALKLSALDQRVATAITGAAGHIGQLNFDDAPLDYPSADDAIQALDNKTAPPDNEPLPGDVEAIDRSNRDLLNEMERDYQQLPDGQVRSDRLADIAAIRKGLEVGDSHLIFLEKPDSPDQMIPAAIAVGDPYTADHVSVTVPGVSSTTRGAIASMTREAEQLRTAAQDIAGHKGESQNVATIAWTGYQPPPGLASSDVLTDSLAQAGAPKLNAFLHDLDAASRNPSQTLALFGHSYGSLTSGIALKGGASDIVDNTVMYGSPGFEATSPAKLGMNDHNFFVMATPDDPINMLGAAAPLHGWGSNPNEIIYSPGEEPRYRFPHLETRAGTTPLGDFKTGASGHADYPRNATEQMTGYNLAAVLLDRADLAVPEEPPWK